MVVDVQTGTLAGLGVAPVRVEISLRRGMRQFTYIGLPNAAVRESKDRIVRALESADLPVPKGNVLISLSPADVRKSGAALDLPIALGILAAEGVVPVERLRRYRVVGELGLTGRVRSIRGALAHVLASPEEGVGILLPRGDAEAIAALEGLPLDVEMVGVDSLEEAVGFLVSGEPPERPPAARTPDATGATSARVRVDLSEVRGQALGKRALAVTAAGGHSLLLSGPPGSGKTLLARRLPGLLPPLEPAHGIESALVYSITGRVRPEGFRSPPFRSPHHTVSQVGLVGGGNPPRPGEVSLAHRGVLFLDELPEFARASLESLRECVEEGSVSIVRAGTAERFPARFQLLAAMNPCPCGFATHPDRTCLCTPGDLQRYARRVSGALLDRFDMAVAVGPVPPDVLEGEASGPDSATVAQRVADAIARQRKRNPGGRLNARLGPEETRRTAGTTPAARALLREAHDRLGLSARGYHRVVRVARTVADLAGRTATEAGDVAEALRFRALAARGAGGDPFGSPAGL